MRTVAADETWVTRSAWVRTLGRPDAIDEIADQFERPSDPPSAAPEAAWSGPGWPQRPRGWAETSPLHADTPERRAS